MITNNRPDSSGHNPVELEGGAEAAEIFGWLLSQRPEQPPSPRLSEPRKPKRSGPLPRKPIIEGPPSGPFYCHVLRPKALAKVNRSRGDASALKILEREESPSHKNPDYDERTIRRARARIRQMIPIR